MVECVVVVFLVWFVMGFNVWCVLLGWVVDVFVVKVDVFVDVMMGEIGVIEGWVWFNLMFVVGMVCEVVVLII